MSNINEYLRSKTDFQLDMISALLIIRGEGPKRFPASLVAEKIGTTGKKLGGAWTFLTKKTKILPPLVLDAGKKKVVDTKGNRKYPPLWMVNKEIDWAEMQKNIENLPWKD